MLFIYLLPMRYLQWMLSHFNLIGYGPCDDTRMRQYLTSDL